MSEFYDRWAIATVWPRHYGTVIFTVYGTGVISRVDPAASPLSRGFSTIEGFDRVHDAGLSFQDRPQLSLDEVLNGAVTDPAGLVLVGYAAGGYIHSTGEVLTITPVADDIPAARR